MSEHRWAVIGSVRACALCGWVDMGSDAMNAICNPILPAMTVTTEISSPCGGIGGGEPEKPVVTVTQYFGVDPAHGAEAMAYALVVAKTQERQHVSDAASKALDRSYPVSSSGLRGVCGELGLMLVTVEEWDALQAALGRKLNPPPYPPKLKAIEAELASLRAQLAEKDDQIRLQKDLGARMVAQLEAENKLLKALFAIDDIDDLRLKLPRKSERSKGALLLQTLAYEPGKFGFGDAGSER